MIKELPLENLAQRFQKSGIYYGWVILVIGTIGVIMSVPGQTMGVGVYTDSLIRALPIDRVNLSLAYLCGTLSSSFLLPFFGKLLDRLGVRKMSVVAALGLAFSLALLAQSELVVNHLIQKLPFSPSTISFVVLLFTFLGVRHFGQGQMTMVARTAMGRWFDRHRGKVLGISGLFVAFAFGVAPLALNKLIENFKWQGSLWILSATLLVMAVFSWALYRNSPEESGVPLDGDPNSEDNTEEAKLKKASLSMTVQEARKTAAFWIFCMGMVAQALIITGVIFHLGRIAELQVVSREKAFALFLPMAIFSTLADLAGGFVSDRIPIKYLLAVMQLGLFTGLLSLQWFGTEWGYWLTAIGLGTSGGLFSLLTGAAWPKLFGRLHLGSISGFAMAFMVSGSALGPYIFSLSEAYTGSFSGALWICAVFPLMVFLFSFKATAPIKKLMT